MNCFGVCRGTWIMNESGTHVHMHTHTHTQYTVQYFCLCVVHRSQDIRRRQQYVDLVECVRNNAGDVW